MRHDKRRGGVAGDRDQIRRVRRDQFAGQGYHAVRFSPLKARDEMIRNTSSNWGIVSRWFHWGLGIATIGMMAYGWWMNHIPARPDRFFHRSIHSNIGYAILLLMVLRL